MSSMDTSNLTIETLKQMFAVGRRFDGRSIEDFRDLKVSLDVSNKAEGSARVLLGKTEVIVGVKLQIGAPYPDSPNKGNLMVSGDMLPLASPRFENGPPGFVAIELPRLVDRAIRESKVIDLEKLNVVPGEKVWTVIVDIYPLNDDGNLIDAATIGALVALKNTNLPGLDKDNKIDYDIKSKDKLPLSKEVQNPVSVSFFKLGDSIIVDPTREEEEACEVRVTWGISKWNKQYMINSCQKSGKTPFTQAEIEKMMVLLPKKYDELNEKLKKFL
ncbi:MAG: exosome complex protein Rrp42 [archaeon]